MAVNYNPKIVTNGLVLYLDAANTKSYSGSGSTWNDLSVNGNKGTLINNPTFDSSNSGSILFNGSNNYVSDVGDVSSFSFIQNTGIFTICAWVKLNELSTTQRGIMGNNRNVGTEKGFLLARGTANSRIRFVITNGSANTYSQQLDNYFDTDWVYVTIVGDGTKVIYYRNGYFFQTGSNLGTLSTGNSTRTLFIGGVSNLTASFLWNGNISQTSIYNRALTGEEILQNYNTTKIRFGLI